MNKICALCNKEKELLDSHIIPKFVFKWMKKTGSGNFRSATTVNKRDQDGPKMKLLCQDCENLFNKYETYFSKIFFHPILNDMLSNEGRNTILEYPYDERLYKFGLTLLWRTLYVNISTGELNDDEFKKLSEVEKEWKEFLTSNTYPKEWNEIHMWVLDKSDDFNGKPKSFDLYIMRATDATIVNGDGVLFIFAKIARFMFFAPIKGFDNKVDFINTNIDLIGGNYLFPQYLKDGRIGSFLINRVHQMNEATSNLSDKQKDNIVKQALLEMDKIVGSDLHRASDEE